MSTPEFQSQFNLNMDVIARFAGLRSMPDIDTVIPDLNGRTSIAECGCVVSDKEIERNGGICDRCCLKEGKERQSAVSEGT